MNALDRAMQDLTWAMENTREQLAIAAREIRLAQKQQKVHERYARMYAYKMQRDLKRITGS